MSARSGWILAGALLFFAKLGVVVVGLDRGLDLGDEGLFLFSLNDPLHVPLHVAFYRVLALVEPPLRFDLIEIRVLRLGVELLAAGALAHAVFAWARSRLPACAQAGFAPFLAIGLLGALLNTGARGFGYNDATNLLVYGATACLFRALAAQPARATLAWTVVAGFALGFQVFVKFPAALLLLAGAAAAAIGLPRVEMRRRIALVAALALGAACSIGLFLATSLDLATLAAMWREAREFNRIAGYGVLDILSVYVWHDYGSHVNGARAGAAALVGFFVARRLARGRGDRDDWALAAGFWLGVAVLAWGAWTLHAVNVHPTLVFLFCFVVLLSPVAWLCWLRRWRAPETMPELLRSEVFAPLLLLFALPFVAMIGTNVALTLRLPVHLAPIGLLLALALGALARSGLRRFAVSAIAVFAVSTTAVFSVHQIDRPYGLPSPLYEQTETTHLLPGLRVDVATKAFVETLHERMTAAGFEPSDPVIALDFMPGLVYALGGRSPGLPFFAFDRPAQNCWTIERGRLTETPFLILGQDMLVEQRACIRAFSFPDEFRLVAAVRNPYEAAIRYFFGGPPMPYVQVFAPRDDGAE